MEVLNAFYSQLMSQQDPTDIPKENKTPPNAKDDDCRSPGTKILIANEMKRETDHLEEFLSIIEKCDMNVQKSSQVHTAVDRDTTCYRYLYQE